MIYLVEQTPNPMRFDFKTGPGGPRLPAPQLRAWALVNTLWSDRGTFPVAARLAPNYLPRNGSMGTGDYTGIIGLNLMDRDGDGFPEVQRVQDDGTNVWVGWNTTSGGWAVKP